MLYFVSDDDNTLYTINRTTGAVVEIGATGRTGIEAIAYYPISGSETLYAADAGDFGTLNLITGAFTEISEIDGGGTADGSAGAQTLNDVDGLMLDGQTLIMWAVERKSDTTPDLLFQIDLTTGQFVPDAFGTNVDYLEITGTGINVDVDDLAVDPISGDIYGVSNDNGSGDALIKVNKTTGEFEFVTTLAQDDVEGLSFHNDGKLYGSEGDSDNRLSLINKTTGAMTDFFTFDPAITGNIGDVEALAALVAPTNLISGTVFEDDDLDGIKDGGETGLANVTVYLYLDQDGDGQVDPEDTRIQTTTTDVNGDYTFDYITTGTLLTRTEFSSYPAGYSLTTDNVETITFTDGINFGETDSNNDFGLGTGTDCDGDGITDFFEGTGDADGDGILNQCDLDSDNDGILDSVEGTEDFDDDGIPNYLDRDSDDDGIPDAIEANGGIRPAEYVELQGNLSGAVGANGIVDTRETAPESGVMLATNPDSDGDTYVDYLDLDSDNDGIMDLREAGGTVDVDSDGQIDSIVDANGNGYADALETSPFAIPNTDLFYENSNGLTRRPNYIDIDSDADGIDDTREGLSTVDYRFPTLTGDADGDGILDFWDISEGVQPIVPVDTDGDSTPDYTDTNSDNDPESDFIEGNDADNNGTADETNTGLDANGNGLDDRFDTACSGVFCSSDVALPDTDGDDEDDFRDFEGVAIDTDGDGVPDTDDIDDDNDGILDVDESEVLDTDGDGVPNSLDLDSDNDGILDIIEAGGVDTDDDGEVDSATDTDGDGWANTFDSDNGGTALANPDTDGDGINNFLDLDSDGDGVVDLIESQATTGTPIIPTGTDTDGDGIDNAFDVTGGTPTDPVDTETDGTPDYLDTDSDNDGFSDALEAWDTDGNGIANVVLTGNDLDQDGLDNAFDDVVGPNSTTNVYNNEDALDFPDVTTSGLTSERDWREDNAVDSDGDGQINSVDIDDDDDGILDVDEGNGDFDNDGIINSLDLDSDNDGIPDIIEAGGVDTDDDGRVDDNTDTDNDGWADTFDSDNGGTALAEPDTDSDGLKNFVDVDSDGDGIVDLIESQATSGSPDTPSGTDTDLDGLDNTFDTDNAGSPTDPVDTDTDGTPDYIDADADNDGFTDALEGWDTDGDLTANVVSSGTDTDGDGLDDAFDDVVGPNGTTNASNNETALSFPDVTTAGNSERDWREASATDSDLDGEPDSTDIDDDNDGILDVDENCGDTSAAPVNSVEDSSVVDGGEISKVNDGVIATDDGARFNTIGHYVVIDLGADIPSGTDIDFGLWKSNTDAKTMRIAQLSSAAVDLGGGTNAETIDQAAISNAVVTTYTYTLDADTRYVQIEMTARSGGRIELIEATLGTYFLCTQDTDGDGIIDALDLDSDNDGIPDIIEAGGVDSNNDGRVDDDTDTDGDGWADTFDSDNGGIALINPDTDNDGIKNFLDLDSDNDGIEDIIEGGGVDTDDDGLVDSATDSDADGWANTFDSDNGGTALVVPDTDADGLENYIDIDADGDGIVDLIESQATTGSPIVPTGTDTDGDGIDDAFDSDNGGTPTDPEDTDADSTPDYIDFNSDNDSFSDALEGYDTDNDQVANTVPAGLDSDGDGLDDNYDTVVGPNATTNVYNNEDANDFPDVSTSGLTSERDWREANTLDADFDGIDDATDIDDDNDGILDVDEGTGDADGDGIPNNLDLDSDNDGIPDIIEAGGVDTDNDGRVDDDTDTDNDGWANTFDSDNGGTALAEPDSDNDGVKNYIDLDSDNDGILDVTEVNNTDANGDGEVDGFLDADGDGYDDSIEGGILILPNSDLSYETTNGLPELPNYIDIDSDADGIDDTREGYSTAGYQAPINFTDTDGDGVLDFWDVDSGNSPIDPVDTDGAGLDDYVDENSDNDSRSDFIEGNDFNEDGVADVANTGNDTNGNGLDDAFDQDCYGNALSSVATSAGEQQGTSVDITSTDLELVTDGANQIVGMYFPNIAINQSETINSAYIQFQVDEAETGVVNLTIEGQLAANPSVFTTGVNNISLRGRTIADESWSPADWTNIGEASTDQRTVDISSIIQEIVNQGGWSNGNPLVLIITGPTDTDTRTAEDNPTLVINFGSGITFCSSNVALQDGDLDGEKDWRDSNGLEAPSDQDADGIPDIDDIDDDNDGILDTDEGCTDTAVSGANASAASQSTATVTNPANGIDGVNANFAAFTNDGAVMEVELRGGSIVTTGTIVTVRAQKTNDVASSMTVTESTDGISYVNAIEYSFATDDVYEDKAYTLATDATHIRITYNEFTGDLRVDNVSYPAFSIACTGNDTDSDGIADHLDIDADGDGIVDLIESQATTGSPVVPVGVDTDGDGLDDAFDSDCAPCGVVTGVPTVLVDTDGDLTDDFLDFNSDDDTFTDLLEGWDTDGNLVANIVPSGIDADNDGLDDAFDLVSGINSTTNVYNTQDAFDFPDVTTLGNTERDWREQNLADSDLDGIQDSNDIDDDNDGILDWDEGCSTGITEAVAGVDSGGGGVDSGQFSLINDGALTDDQGIIMNAIGEYIIVDLGREHPSGVDINFVLWKSNTSNKELRFAQLPDNVANLGGGSNAQTINQSAIAVDPAVTTFTYTLNATTQYIQIEMTARSGGRLEVIEGTIQAYDFGCSVDTDGDGVDDGLDLDSDNDGIPDIIEAGGVDANNDGRVDDNTDTDNDGWANTFDADNGGTALTNPDTDNDNINDYRDLDSDNDGIEDIIEAGGVDTDNDGVVDSATDLDGDGWANTFDSDNGGNALEYTDTDGDGLRNNIDIDADGDGIVDLIESQATSGSPVVPGGTDSDSDGIDNAFDVTGGTPTDPVDTDGDGTPDYLDFNSDGDSFTDLIEGYDTDGDFVADTTPAGTDTDGDGLDDNFDTVVGPNSTTNVYNNEDALDFPDVTTAAGSDQDWREVNEIDTDADGVADVDDIDDDNDGILDVDEGGCSSSTVIDATVTGIGEYTVLGDGQVTISINGGDGGGGSANAGGSGATITNAVFNVTAGDVIRFVVGEGSAGSGGNSAGGAGSTGVFINNTLVMVAGGGGGGDNSAGAIGLGANSGTAGDAGTGTSAGAGGTSGSGGGESGDAGGAAGGGGINAAGTDDDTATGGAAADLTPADGVTLVAGGVGEGSSTAGGRGFTGGGGGADGDYSGGGGGYSGGGAAGAGGGAGGGGSFIETGFSGYVSGSVTAGVNGAGGAIGTTGDDGFVTIIASCASVPTDTDNDGIPDQFDLDSDNDGIPDIIEAGGVDTDNDGRVDNDTDTDGDGWANTFDSDNGGTALTDPDTDLDELENRIDIDSDDDGIVDLIESQATTATPVIPVGSDLDEDGIDDAFDVDCNTCGGVTGVPTVIVNTDGTDNPDYIDTDSDNDGLDDVIEAYDTDGDYLPDETPNGNDDDNDGLDDNFDDITGPNSTTNNYNNQTSNSFPDVTTSAVTSERDWRESNAENCQPGGISGNFLLWLRADDGGTSWRDVSNNYVSVSSVGSFTTGGNINFNPSNFFGGSSYYNTTLSINAGTHPDLAVIVVYQPTIDNSGAVWGEDNGSFDRYVLDNNGVGENEAVSNGTGLTSNVTGLYAVGTTTISSVLFDEDQASGSTVYLNGSNTLTNFTSDHASETSNNLQIGGLGDATNRFNGIVSEVIVYNSLLTNATDFQQIQSYLALKYGVTLSSDTDGDATAFEAGEGDYIASNGSTIFWDASDNTTFHNNVAGIARDDSSCLNQLQSQSENSDAIVAIGLDDNTDGLEASNSQNGSAFSNDFSALIWGHDGESLYDNSQNIDYDPFQVNSRLNREWRVRETNTIGTVTVRFDVSNLLGPTGVGTNDESQIVLLLDANGDFSENAQLVPQAFVVADDGFVSFQVDFSDGQYFTLASGELYALPITLLEFGGTAFDDYVQLNWTTLDETNNSMFRIERSGDGVNFETIGYRDGAGTSTDVRYYAFRDDSPLEPSNYYRLVDIDNNGVEDISEIIRVDYQSENVERQVYPNPASRYEAINVPLNAESQVDLIYLYQSNGTRVPIRSEQLRDRLVIWADKAKSGLHFLHVEIDGQTYRMKVLIKD